MNEVASGNIALIGITVLLVLGAMASFSFYLGRKTKTSSDWAIGGRNIPWYVIIGTQYATAIGGAVLVAHVGIGYNFGWATLTYGILAGGGLLLLSLLAVWLRKNEFTTVPDVLSRLYGEDKTLISIAALMSIIAPLTAVSTQIVSFGKLFSSITGLSTNFLMIAFALIALLYVIPAGFTSVAWTDFIFGCFMIIMTVGLSVFAIRTGGGWSNIISKLPAEITSFPSAMGSIGWKVFFLWALALLPGSLTMQIYYQRIFAIDKVSKVRMTLVTTFVAIILAEIFAAILGLTIRSMNPELAGEAAAGWFLQYLPAWFLAIYSAFIVVTIMSTVDSFVQSAVVNITKDFYKKIFDPEANDNYILKLSRWVSVAVVAFALIAATIWPQALGWLIIGYSYSAAGLLFPIFLGYFLKDAKFLTPIGCIAGMLGGVLGCIYGQTTGSAIPYVGHGLVSSLFFLLIASALTRGSYYAKKIEG